MRVLRGFSSAVSTPTALTIGNFDGVHRGHVILLERLVDTAREKGLLPAVLTFEPHPREFFRPDSAPARLTILREKLELIAACGIDTVMICAFNADFAALTAESFVERVLLKSLATKHLLIGDDFRFGQGRCGDFALLQDAGQKRGFTVKPCRRSLSKANVFPVLSCAKPWRRVTWNGQLPFWDAPTSSTAG